MKHRLLPLCCALLVVCGRVAACDHDDADGLDVGLVLSGYLAGIGPDGLRLPGGFRTMSGLQNLFRQLFRAQLPVSVAHATGADLIIALDTTVDSPEAKSAIPSGATGSSVTAWARTTS